MCQQLAELQQIRSARTSEAQARHTEPEEGAEGEEGVQRGGPPRARKEGIRDADKKVLDQIDACIRNGTLALSSGDAASNLEKV